MCVINFALIWYISDNFFCFEFGFIFILRNSLRKLLGNYTYRIQKYHLINQILIYATFISRVKTNPPILFKFALNISLGLKSFNCIGIDIGIFFKLTAFLQKTSNNFFFITRRWFSNYKVLRQTFSNFLLKQKFLWENWAFRWIHELFKWTTITRQILDLLSKLKIF